MLYFINEIFKQMKKTIIALFTLSGITCFGQQLTCEDFKEGVFEVVTVEPIKMKWEIIRTGNEQVEVIKEIPQEYIDKGFPTDPSHIKIQWIDDCTYISKFDDSKFALTEIQKQTNKLGGMKTKMIKINGDCLYFKSSMKVNSKEEFFVGKMCK